MMGAGESPGRQIFESAERYLRLRKRLVIYFEGRGCWNAEDLADESLMRLVPAVSKPGFDGNAEALAFGIARNVLYEWRRKEGVFSPLGDVEPASPRACPISADEAAAVAAKAIAQIKSQDRELLEQYFIDRLTADEMAARWNLSPAGIRTRIHRLRGRLQRILGGK
jgi:RNA polymerase sigma factor (sigma-70 family)